MKILRWLPCAFLLASTAAAQQRVDQRRAVTSTASIRLGGSFGALRVIGWDKDTVAIVGTLAPGTRFDGHLGGGGPAPTPGLKMFLEAPDDASPAATKLELYVPARARVWIKGGSADLEVSGVTGGLDLNVIGGSVRVRGNPSQLTVEAMDAAVTIDGSPEWLRAKTATGDITFSGSGVDVALTSVSGAIRAGKGAVERARIETVTGAVVFVGDLPRAAALDVSTHSGSVELWLPRTASVEYDLASMTGAIENALTGKPAVAGREGRGQEIGLSTGGGSARVTVRTFKGHIRLRAR